MAECLLVKPGGGIGSEDCTAAKANVLAGVTAVTKDSGDEAVAGTMANKGAWTSRIGMNGKAVIPAGYHNGSGYVDQAITNRGAVSASLGINGTYTIPEGYHNGSGKVTQSIATMGAQTVTPGNTQKVVSCSGKYMTGNVTVPAVANLIAANIKKGVTVGGVAGTWEGWITESNFPFNNGNRNTALDWFNMYVDSITFGNSISVVTNSGNSLAKGVFFKCPTDITGYKEVIVQYVKHNSSVDNICMYIFSGKPVPGWSWSKGSGIQATSSTQLVLNIESYKGSDYYFGIGNRSSSQSGFNISSIEFRKYT